MGQTREKRPSKSAARKVAEKSSQDANSSTTSSVKFPMLATQLQNTMLTAGTAPTNIPTTLSSSARTSASQLSLPSSHLSAKSSASSLRSSNSHVFSNNPVPYSSGLIEIQSTKTKGRAIFTTQRITPGTLLHAEIPILRLTTIDEEVGDEECLQAYFSALSHKNQEAVLRLHDTDKDGFSKLRSVYYSNCYNLDKHRSDRGGSCVGLVSSRINHSCVPNVQFSFVEEPSDDLWEMVTGYHFVSNSSIDQTGPSTTATDVRVKKQGLMLFYAVKPISRGREILACYETIYATRAQRAQTQMMYYGFKCDCEACTAPTDFWARSDERRRDMIKLRQKVKNGRSKLKELDVNAKAVAEELEQDLIKWESLLVKEGILGTDLLIVYEELGRCADMIDQQQKMEWLIRAKAQATLCLGEESRRVRELNEKLEKSI